MKKGQGFLSLSGALPLSAAFAFAFWAAVRHTGQDDRPAAASDSAYTDYLVVCSGPSNACLAAGSGAGFPLTFN